MLTLLLLIPPLLAVLVLPPIHAMGQGMLPQTVAPALATKFNAKCLSGAAPTYLLRRNTSSTRWLIFLEGGGWCYGNTTASTISSCSQRAGAGAAMLRRSIDNDVLDYGGILGRNSTTNPQFYTWNVAFLHYCDGASFGSNRQAPINITKPDGTKQQIYMRGRSNFDALISDLLLHHGMDMATDIILSGGSAGGLAVFYNLDHLAKDLLPLHINHTIRVTGFPDAGFFMDASNYVADFRGADPVWNVTGSIGTNRRCLKAYSTADAWHCLLAPFLLEHIETPIFIMNSAYDAWQIVNNNVGCVSLPKKPCNDTSVQQYGEKLKERVKQGLRNKTKRFHPHVVNANGAYIDSCYVHEQNVNYCSDQNWGPNCVGWSPLESGSLKWGYSTAIQHLPPQEAFSMYYFSKGSIEDEDEKYLFIDDEMLQKNPTCIYQGSMSIS